MFRMLASVAMAMLASGCATRGVLDFKCAGFATTKLEPSRLVRDIQSDVVTAVGIGENATLAADPMALAFDGLAQRAAMPIVADSATAGAVPAVLLLSGGGQWGAFGAGYLEELNQRGQAYPEVEVVTGVSTGALQSLFVATDALDVLAGHYRPARESDVVNRNPSWRAAVTGSLAGLKPLRRRVETALCNSGPEKACEAISALAETKRGVFIGMVEATTGDFLYVDAVAIARGATADTVEARRNAQQCLTGVALASAAMPVFFQQVSINGRTFYDGGVRHSVFEENIAAKLDAAIARAKPAASDRSSASASASASASGVPALYVLRNGPTIVLGDKKADRPRNALDAALRAEAIVVNELEIGSIASLRLAHPSGPIFLVTADGYDKRPDGFDEMCTKRNPQIMFDPDFMKCLQRFGAFKARREPPWKSLSPLPQHPEPTGEGTRP